MRAVVVLPAHRLLLFDGSVVGDPAGSDGTASSARSGAPWVAPDATSGLCRRTVDLTAHDETYVHQSPMRLVAEGDAWLARSVRQVTAIKFCIID
ncbi:MAG: hypothetical protein K2X61_15035 [Caulobacteraceae bacterium]|nr:hypothetical protein [Caulobacteraceae bacterium]